jgi:hypothetical protein
MDNYFDQFDAPAAPSGGGGGNYFDQFDPPPPPSSGGGGNFFDQFDSEEERRRRELQARPPPPQPAPEAEGMLASGLRSFAHEAPAVVAGAAGALYGAGAGAAAGPVGAIAGGVGGAIAGGFGGAAIADTGLKALGYDDSHQRAVNEKANPWSSAIGQGLAQVLGFGAGTASTAARLAGAGIGGGIEAGAQIYQGDFEPSKIAAQTAAGAAFTNPYKWGSRIEQAGQRAGDQIAEGYRARGAERAGILEGDYTVNEPSRKQLEYHGTAGSKSDSFGSEAATPPRKDSDVGDAHQVRGEGSDVGYMKKPDREVPGDQGAGLNTGGRDPDLDLAIKAKSGVDTGEFHGPEEFGRYGAKLDQEFPKLPNAEAQGRPLREEPTPPPAAAPAGGLSPAEMQELMELRAAAAQRAAPPPADAARAPRVDAAPPAAAAAAPMPPVKRAPPGRNTDDLSLIDYLASHGGLQDNPEVRAAVQANPFIPGFGQLIRSDGKGMTLDRAWELVARGDKKYLHDEGDFAGRTPDTSWQDVARMINDEVGGKPAFQLGREGTKRSLKDAASAVNDQNLNRIYNDIDNFLTDVGVDPLADRPFRDRMAQIMNKEGITDPEIAHEMVMNEPPPAAKGGQKPGEEVPFDMADEFLRRGVIERGRSGRPIRTAPLPIGSEEGILKAGLEKVQTTPRPEVDAPPTTEAMGRKAPPMSREEMQRLIAESGKTATKVPLTSRAIGKGTLTQAEVNAAASNVKEAGTVTPPAGKAPPPAATPEAELARGKPSDVAPELPQNLKDAGFNIGKADTGEWVLTRNDRYRGHGEDPNRLLKQAHVMNKIDKPDWEANYPHAPTGKAGIPDFNEAAKIKRALPEELAAPYPLRGMLDEHHLAPFDRALKDQGKIGTLLREASEVFDAAVKKIKDAGYLPKSDKLREIPELKAADLRISEIGGTMHRLMSGIAPQKGAVSSERVAKDMEILRGDLDRYSGKTTPDMIAAQEAEGYRTSASKTIGMLEKAVEAGDRSAVTRAVKKANAVLSTAPPEVQAEFRSKVDALRDAGYKAAQDAKAAGGTPKQKQLAELSDVHSRNMESALDAIERAVESGNKSDVLKAANKAKNILAGVPKEVLADDKPYWSGFKTTIANMQKKGYVTATQEAARAGDANAQKILDTGVDPTAKPIKEVPQTAEQKVAANDKRIAEIQAQLDKKVADKLAEGNVNGAKAAIVEGINAKDGGTKLSPDGKGPKVAKGRPNADLPPANQVDGELKAAQAKQAQPQAQQPQAQARQATPVPPGAAPPGAGGPPPPGGPPHGPPPPGGILGGGPPQGPPPPGGRLGGGPMQGPPSHRPATAHDLSESRWASLQRIFSPELRPSGREGMDVWRKHRGEAERLTQQQLARFDNAMHTAANQLSEIDARKWVNYLQGGRALNEPGHAIYDPNYQPPANLQVASAEIRKAFNEFARHIGSLPQTQNMTFRLNYLNQMWKNPDLHLEGKGAGGAGMGGKAHHHDYEAGRSAGLIPVTNNPIEMLNRYAMSAERFLTTQKTINELERRRAIWWGQPKAVGAAGGPTPHMARTPPAGYAEVPHFRNDVGESAWMPKDMAYIMNNQQSKVFNSDAGDNIMDGIRRFKNAATASELGMSLYHPFTVSFESVAKDITRAIQTLGTGPGSTERAGKMFLNAWISPYTKHKTGGEWIERYLDKAARTPEQQRILDAMAAADIRPVGVSHTLDFDLTSADRKAFGDLGSLWTSYKRGSLEAEFKNAYKEIMGGDWKQGAAFAPNVAIRVLRTMAQPIFEHWIPRIKIATLAQDMEAWLVANPTATDKEFHAITRKMADSVDNIMGEMVVDHLGMNKAAKSAAFTALRSFSFTVGGPGMEISGGIYSGAKGALKGENRLKMSSKEFDPKAGYSMGFAFTAVMLGSMMQFMRTGEWPSDWRDIVTPKTGGQVKSAGQVVPERVLLPGYHKDFLGYFYHPLDEVSAKIAGPWKAMWEQAMNRDYRGDPIIPPAAAGIGEQLKARAAHAVGALAPISFRGLGPKEGSNISLLERGLGFREPGAYIENPERIHQIQTAQERKAWRDKERHERKDLQIRGLPPRPRLDLSGGQQP